MSDDKIKLDIIADQNNLKESLKLLKEIRDMAKQIKTAYQGQEFQSLSKELSSMRLQMAQFFRDLGRQANGSLDTQIFNSKLRKITADTRASLTSIQNEISNAAVNTLTKSIKAATNTQLLKQAGLIDDKGQLKNIAGSIQDMASALLRVKQEAKEAAAELVALEKVSRKLPISSIFNNTITKQVNKANSLSIAEEIKARATLAKQAAIVVQREQAASTNLEKQFKAAIEGSTAAAIKADAVITKSLIKQIELKQKLNRITEGLDIKSNSKSIVAQDSNTSAVQSAKLNLQLAINSQKEIEKRISTAQILADAEDLAILKQQHIAAEFLVRDRQNALAAAKAQVAEERKQAGDLGPLGKFKASFGINRLAGTVATQAGFIASYKAITAVTQAISGGIQFVLDYDEAIHDLKAITNSTSEEMLLLDGVIKKVAGTSKFSALEISGAAKTLAQAGYDTSQIGDALEGVVLLATATGETLDTAAGLASSVIAQFHLDASDMTHVADVLVAAINGSKLTLEQLSTGLQYSGNTAAALNLKFEETVAILGAVANTGIKTGSTLGTGLTAVLSEMINPSTKFKAILEEIGLTTDDVSLKSHKFGEVMATLRKAGFSTADAYEAFGRRAASAFLAAESNPQVIKDLSKSFEDNGQAAKANATQMEAINNQLKLMKNNFNLFLTETSGPFLTFFAKLLSIVNDIATGMGIIFTKTTEFLALDDKSIDKRRRAAYDRQFTTGIAGGLVKFGPLPATDEQKAIIDYRRKYAEENSKLAVALASKEVEDKERRSLENEKTLNKQIDNAIKSAENTVISVENLFKHINDALELSTQHIDNLIKGSGDINSPLYGKYNDAEIAIFEKRKRAIAAKELQNKIGGYSSQIAAQRSVLSAQQASAGTYGRISGIDLDPARAANDLGKYEQAQKAVAETQAKITDLTYEQAKAQEELNTILGKGTEANVAIGEQIRSVLEDYSKAMSIQSQFKYNLKSNIEDALDSARSSFSEFVVSVASGTQSIGSSFKSMATSILQSMLKMQSDKLAAGILGKLVGFAGSLFGSIAGPGYSAPIGPTPSGAPLPSTSLNLAMGGKIPFKFASMGLGVTGRDSVPVMAMPGEYMLRKSAVDLIGRENLDQINAMGNRTISRSAPAPMEKGGSGAPVNVYVVSPDQKPSLGKNDVLAIISEDIVKSGNTKKLIKTVMQGG